MVFFLLAQQKGFEPLVHFCTPAFQASTFDHSDTAAYFEHNKYTLILTVFQVIFKLSFLFVNIIIFFAKHNNIKLLKENII